MVTGDSNRNKVLTVPGGGMATIKIELPDNWNDLMQKLGYKTLESYYLPEITPKKSSLQNSQREKTAANKQNNHQKPIKEQYIIMRQQRGFDRNKNTSNHRRPTKEHYQKIRKQQRNLQM